MSLSRERLASAARDGTGDEDRNEFLDLLPFAHPQAVREVLWELLTQFRSDPIAELTNVMADGDYRSIKHQHPAMFAQLKRFRTEQAREIELAIRRRDRKWIHDRFPSLARALNGYVVGGNSSDYRQRTELARTLPNQFLRTLLKMSWRPR